ncbi:MAG: GtrA family protein [Clostridia bacterium]
MQKNTKDDIKVIESISLDSNDQKSVTNNDGLNSEVVSLIDNDNNAIVKKSFKQILKQFLVFLCFSLGAGLIEISSFSIIILFGNVIVADVVSVVLSCLFNFTLNRKYTFKSVNNIYLGMVLYGLFYLVFTPLGALFIDFLVKAGVNEFLAKAIKMIINFVLDFLYCKFVIFKVKAPKTKEIITSDSESDKKVEL